jgi:hypothetical protein
MDDAHKSGRPFGGFFWVINADIELVSYDFISSNIKLIKIEANKRLITIIGVYCIYNNNTSEHFQRTIALKHVKLGPILFEKYRS